MVTLDIAAIPASEDAQGRGATGPGLLYLSPQLVQSWSLTSRAIPTLLLLAPHLLPGPAHNQFAFLWTC